MKKWLISFIIIILVFLTLWDFYFTYPKNINRSISGVEYQLGSNNNPKLVTVGIKGKLQRSILGNKTFDGKIDLKGVSHPNLDDKDKLLKIKFQKNGAGDIIYAYYKEGKPFVRSYGVLFINKDFRKVTIEEFEIANDGVQTWESQNGLLVSGPAKSKNKALQIANELMKNILNGNELH
jgi:hypothetical protein